MRPIALSALAAVTTLVAACAHDPVRTVTQSYATVGGVDDFAAEANSHHILVTVRGTGFGLAPKALDEALVARMQGQAWGAHPRFVLEPDAEISKIFSVVLVVGAAGPANSLALCAHPETVTPPMAGAHDPLHISAALCRFDKAVASVEGYADNATIVDEPRVASLVAASIRDLTREQRPNRFKRDD